VTAERDELGDITDQGPWEREDEHTDDEPESEEEPEDG
jgi:hypothetical protein